MKDGLVNVVTGVKLDVDGFLETSPLFLLQPGVVEVKWRVPKSGWFYDGSVDVAESGRLLSVSAPGPLLSFFPPSTQTSLFLSNIYGG